MKETNWLINEYFAHRGFHIKSENIPENSLSAFQKALDFGYAIECDVRLTKDLQVVVFHDHNLARICGVDKYVEDLTLNEINQYTLFDTSEKIPLLKEVLELVDGKIPLLIEVKAYKNYKTFSKTLNVILEDYEGKYAIQSYDPRVVYWYKKKRPEILRGQIAQLDLERRINWFVRFLANYMFLNIITKPDFINYRISDIPLKILDKLHEKGVPILVHTAKSKEDFALVLQYYDNAMFEGFHPDKKKGSTQEL